MKTSAAAILNFLNKSKNNPFFQGAISDIPTFKKSIPTTQTTWLGKVNSDWDCPDNWSNGIPNTGNHAFIPATTNDDNFPVITGNLSIDYTVKIDGCLYIESTVEVMPEGLLQNEGLLEIRNIGTIINEGKISNLKDFNNYGTLINKNLVNNSGHFFNEGVVDNEATFINLNEFTNNGFVDSDTEIVNKGSLNIDSERIEFHNA